MFEIIGNLFNSISIIDIIYIVLTILSLLKCYKKGFVLSVLSIAKWLVAYILTLIIFPKAKPFVENIIDNEYILDIGLGISIFVINLLFILMIITLQPTAAGRWHLPSPAHNGEIIIRNN